MSSKQEIEKSIIAEKNVLKQINDSGINVDMTRGRPSRAQSLIAMPMLQNAGDYNYDIVGGDARNYGGLQGIDSARELFAQLLEVNKDEVLVHDGSSLDLMYTLVQFAMQFGVLGATPWNKLDKVKFLCPAPGYDRHFVICEQFGIEMLTIPILEDGPDMDMIESIVSSDESVKGIWCVPKYSNPTGIVYSDEVVNRFANLKPLAKDFRVFWDNAYFLHTLYEQDVNLKNVFDVARGVGSLDMFYQFTSTSKITFAGSGIAALATSSANMQDILRLMAAKIINPNKVNQVMHVEYLKDVQNVKRIMQIHADLLRPKFELFDVKMADAFKNDDRVKWSKPRGGYFISLDVPHCAKRIVQLASEAGIKFTNAGATFPYKNDVNDSNIRIAPSVPSLDEMQIAVDVLIHSIKLALLEREYEN